MGLPSFRRVLTAIIYFGKNRYNKGHIVLILSTQLNFKVLNITDLIMLSGRTLSFLTRHTKLQFTYPTQIEIDNKRFGIKKKQPPKITYLGKKCFTIYSKDLFHFEDHDHVRVVTRIQSSQDRLPWVLNPYNSLQLILY